MYNNESDAACCSLTNPLANQLTLGVSKRESCLRKEGERMKKDLFSEAVMDRDMNIVCMHLRPKKEEIFLKHAHFLSSTVS